MVWEMVVPVLSWPIEEIEPLLKLNVGNAEAVECWLVSMPCSPSCEIAALPCIGNPSFS
jgi:hypothetical protein